MKLLIKIKELFFKDKEKNRYSRKFENFIGFYFKESGEFDVLKRPNEFIDGLKSNDDNQPDYKFKDKRSNKEFWVECKWRPHWNNDRGLEKTFFKRDNLYVYKKIQEESKRKVFIALGIGTREEDKKSIEPEELYFFPVNMLSNKPDLRKEYLIKNKREHNFKYKKPKFFPDYDELR